MERSEGQNPWYARFVTTMSASIQNSKFFMWGSVWALLTYDAAWCRKIFAPIGEGFQLYFKTAWRWIGITFGMLGNEKKILQRPLYVSTYVAEDKSRACLILHNFALTKSRLQHWACPWLSRTVVLWRQCRKQRTNTSCHTQYVCRIRLTFVWTGLLGTDFGNNGRHLLVPKHWSAMRMCAISGFGLDC